MPDIWNEDGTPKVPDPAKYGDPEKYAQTPFADLGADGWAHANQSTYLNYARIKREARAQRSPEIGDIVHFWGGKEDPAHDHCFAAIVMETETFTDTATIRVHVPHGAFMDWRVDHDEDKGHDTWHWPCGEGR